MRRPTPGLVPRLLAVGVAVLAAIAVVVALGRGGDPVEVPRTNVPVPPAARGEVEPFEDPFVYDPGSRERFERRAAAGTSHALYALSPGERRPAPHAPRAGDARSSGPRTPPR